jgi:hypothetical protein
LHERSLLEHLAYFSQVGPSCRTVIFVWGLLPRDEFCRYVFCIFNR